jgi:hypothetical protein
MPDGMMTYGVKELIAKYQAMGKAGLIIGKAAVRAGGIVVRDAYKANVHRVSGKTAMAIRLRVSAGKRGAQAIVGFSHGPFQRKGTHTANPFSKIDPFYIPWANEGHFVGKRLSRFEGGTLSERRAKYAAASKLAGRKMIEGTHWIQKAQAESESSARDAISQTLAEGIRKADASGGAASE